MGGEREYMIHGFLSREKATTSNLDLSAIIQERESRNFEHMRTNFSTFLLPTLTSNLLKAAELGVARGEAARVKL